MPSGILPRRAPAPLSSSATGRSPTRPRTSSTFTSLFEQRANAGGTLLQPRRLGRQQFFRRAPSRGAHDAFAHEAGQSTVIIGTQRADRLESRHRPSAVHDQHWRTAFDAVDERAEIVLSFGDTGLLHNGQNSLMNRSFQASILLAASLSTANLSQLCLRDSRRVRGLRLVTD